MERTGATKGAVYFHFRSKLDIARALVDEKYTNWPVIVAEVTGTGLRGLAAAEELTQRVGRVFADDVRVRAAMKLTQTVLPPAPEDNPYARWTELVAVFVAQELEDRGLDGVDPREIAVVAVQAFFGAYMIGHELGRLDRLPGDVTRLWGIIGASLAVAQERPAAAG